MKLLTFVSVHKKNSNSISKIEIRTMWVDVRLKPFLSTEEYQLVKTVYVEFIQMFGLSWYVMFTGSCQGNAFCATPGAWQMLCSFGADPIKHRNNWEMTHGGCLLIILAFIWVSGHLCFTVF